MIKDTPDILIIDDNKYDSEFLLETLSGNNKVKALEDGSEALDYLFAAGEYSGRDVSRQPRVDCS
jgi:CheY-like chemotaxis protein